MKQRTNVLTIPLAAGLFAAGILLAACTIGKDSDSGGGPAAPYMVTAESASSTSINLTWTAVSGAAKYKIYTAVTSTGTYRYVDETEYRTYTVNDLVPASTYYFKVSSVDIDGIEGPRSTYAVATTTMPVPAIWAAVLSSDSIRIDWNPVAGATSYLVYRSGTASADYTLAGAASTTSYTDTGLTPLTTYYYKVSAVTAKGEGEQSSPASTTTPNTGVVVVPAPSGIQTNAISSTSIQISWTAISQATGYRIYRSGPATGSFTPIGNVTAITFTDTELSPLTVYYYRISTVHSGGESEQSITVSATTQAVPVEPDPPDSILVPGSTIAGKLAWLQRSAESHNTYVVVASANENIASHTIQYTGGINITVILRGDGTKRTIRLSQNGRMFTVSSNVTFVLGNNITLQGHNQNTGTIVHVNGGIFRMNAGSAITGNTGGGVYVYSGTFEMNGGTISGNTASNGGGVYMGGSGTFFTMSNGTISGNTASSGGGVYIYYGTFTMSGGTISGNTANNGGGVTVTSITTFTMRGGTITGNTANKYGGGVCWTGGNFAKTGGTITGYNSDPSNGNAVRDIDGVLARRGHAVYVSANKRKETTAGPDVNLSDSSSAGWDD